MAFALIFVILYIGINFNTNALRVSQNPCGFCGLYYGKSCTQVYYDPASKISVKDYLETIALDNAKVSPELKDYINHSFSINMTELSNIYKITIGLIVIFPAGLSRDF